jgi:Lactate dehydrogenase and related dehydrogenases
MTHVGTRAPVHPAVSPSSGARVTTGAHASTGTHPAPASPAALASPRVWIIDEEWGSVDFEVALVRETYPDAQVLHSTYSYEGDLATFGRTCDLVLAQIYAELPATVIDQLTHCRGIAVMGGGFDRVDVSAAAARSIPVTNVQGYCAEDIAQYVLTTILNDAKPQVGAVGPDGPRPWGLLAYPQLPHRVAGRTLLVVGYGRIGRTVARRAVGIGLHVIALDPHVGAAEMAGEGVEKVDWDEGFSRADVVSLHCNLGVGTRGLIGEREFALMPDHALLVNTSRGAVIDEGALARALDEGVIRAAVLDVVTHEPPRYDEEIFEAPHASITPHVSYLSYESITELRTRCVRNALAMYAGEIPEDCVNSDALPRPALASAVPNEWKE